jgi:hypothetical protein
MVPLSPIQAVNAGTTYGVDGSSENNFGLGSAYLSPNQVAMAETAKDATRTTIPMWILAGVIIAAVVML